MLSGMILVTSNQNVFQWCSDMIQAWDYGLGLFLINNLDRDTPLWEKREADGVWERDAKCGVKFESENPASL